MRISDWSSDVCSSDLLAQAQLLRAVKEGAMRLLILGAVGLVAAASMIALLAQTVDGIDVQAIKKRSADLQADAEAFVDQIRSDERRVGQECVSTCRSRWSADPQQKNYIFLNIYANLK